VKRIAIVVVALAIVSFGLAYAAEKSGEKAQQPVKTVVDSTAATVETAVEGTAATLDIEKNNPVTTAANTVVKTAEAGAKTVTFQKADKPSAAGSNCSK
jgi:hypothetical protein